MDVVGIGSGVTAIAAGRSHTCALTSAGGVACWGSNSFGQLGDGASTQRLTPMAVSGLASGVAAITAGVYHSCALTSAGGVQCWGYNGYGQLGDGTQTNRLTPVAVSGLSSGVAAIAAGAYHTCALTTGGAVLCWGYNGYGQLGDGSTTQRLTPVWVSGLTSGVAAIAAGGYHSCALTSAGWALCWGENYDGQLGDGSFTDRLTPVGVSGLWGGVAAITAGNQHSCALTSAGGVQCWGYNEFGQLGYGGTYLWQATPVTVSGLSTGVATLDAGWGHTCALASTGGVQCWGRNDSGQLGDGSTTNRYTPVAVSGLTSGVRAISAGGYHSCALAMTNEAKCWGWNAYGQLGDGTTTSQLTPVAVAGFTAGEEAAGVTAIVAGDSHTCALTSVGGVRCWGRNGNGQVGDGTTTDRLAPVAVSGLTSGVAVIATGSNHSCALTNGGGVKCWGYNVLGQLGDGTQTDRLTPVAVSGLGSGVTAIAAGGAHSCALTSAGGVQCWGYNTYGQLGDGTAGNWRAQPAPAWPSVWLRLPDPSSGSEAAQTAVSLTAESSWPVTGSKTLGLSVSGTGITAGDYALSASSFSFANGSDTATLTFSVQNDGLVEGAETATLTISNPSAGLALGSPLSRTLSIADNNLLSATLSLSGLGPYTYNGSAKAATCTTSPGGLTTTLTYNGSPTAPSGAGSYAVVCHLTQAGYSATDATGTLVINPAPVTLSLSNLSQTYDGTQKSATCTATPSAAYSLTYSDVGSGTGRVNVGSYGVSCAVSDPNYSATPATGTLVIGHASTTAGDLDASFGTGGKLTTPVGPGNDEGYAVAVQSDGKILVAGLSSNGSNNDFALVRYNANGSLDTSFGTAGILTTAVGPGNDFGYALALQSDGKILVAGYGHNGSNNDFALVRYNANGSLDTSFDADGKVLTAVGSGDDRGQALALQSDGKILVAGRSSNDFALVRYNANGSLDAGFGTAGVVTTAVGSGNDFGYALALQSDGKILVAGQSHNGSNYDVALVRYNTNGSLDAGFGTAGKVVTALGASTDGANALALQSDGKILVAGLSDNGSNIDVALVRYNANGSLDTSFGSAGKLTTAVGSGDDRGYALALQPDGKILVAGYGYNGSNVDFALVRYHPDGSLDASFSGDGMVLTAVGSGNDYGYALALQPDGNILVAGSSWNGSNYDFALVRYLGDVANKAEQTISFAALPNKSYGDAPFTVSATATSGLAVSFSSLTTGICTSGGTNGATITLVGTGTCTLAANQGGDGSCNPAPQVTQSFNVAPGSVTLSLSGLSQTYDGTQKSATCTATPSVSTSLSYSDLGSGTGRVNAGSYGVSCAVTDPNYSATPATGTLVIQPAPITLSLSNLGHSYDGTQKSATWKEHRKRKRVRRPPRSRRAGCFVAGRAGARA